MCLQSWSELPEEIVRLIAEKIDLILDFIRFGAVCQSWRYVTLDKRHFSLFLKPQPWLMLTADDGENNRGFYSVSENKIHRINLPEASGCHCFGSPFGWLVTVGFDQNVHLLNPLSRVRIPLPPLSAVKDIYYTANLPGKNRMNYITKAIVSMAPSSSTAEEQILVLIIYGGYKRLAFARPGDTTWSIMLNNMIQFDVLHLNGQFYAVDAYGNVRLCDTNGLRPVSDVFAHPPEDVQGIDRFYLVELRGELHLVARILDFKPVSPPMEFHHYVKTVYIEVYKLDLCTRKWDELQTLDGHAIFIGSNSSFSLKASGYPGCKPNCIYFTDDFVEASGRLIGLDMGIFSMETEKIDVLYEGDDILSRYAPPTWITSKIF